MKKNLIALMLAGLTLSTAGCADTEPIYSDPSSTESEQTVGKPYHYAKVRLKLDGGNQKIYATCLGEHAFLDRPGSTHGRGSGLTRYPEMDDTWCDPDHGQVIQHERERTREETEEDQG